MDCITSFLDIPRFAVSILIIISSTYFTCKFDSNDLLFSGKTLSYVIGFLLILRKTLNTVYLGTGSRPNSKQASSHCPLRDGYQLFTKASFSLVQLASDHQWFFFFFPARLSSGTLTVDVSCGAENSSHDSMGINYQYPTTNFSHTTTFSCFIHSSCLAFSWCGLMIFFSPSSSWNTLECGVNLEREQRRMGRFRRRTNRRKRT